MERFHWYWANFQDDEHWHGSFDTREEVIFAASIDLDPGSSFSIVQASHARPSIPTGADFLEQWADQESESEHCGEDGYDGLSGPKADVEAATAELDDLLKGWFAKHVRLIPDHYCFGEIRNAEDLVTPLSGEVG